MERSYTNLSHSSVAVDVQFISEAGESQAIAAPTSFRMWHRDLNESTGIKVDNFCRPFCTLLVGSSMYLLLAG